MDNKTRLLKNLNEIKKYKEFFNFYPNISSVDDIIDNLHTKIEITHKKCNHQTTQILSEWISKAPYRASRLRFFKSNDINLVCPKCSIVKLQSIIDSLYNREFTIVGFFINTKTKIDIKHNDCNEIFNVRYETLISGKMKCKVCKKSNNFDKESKQDWLLNKLKENGTEDILPQELYKGYNQEILFKHIKCNKTFSETPHNLLRRKNKCPHCNKDVFIINSSNKEFKGDKIEIIQKKMDTYHKDKFKLLSINPDNKITAKIKCLKCNNIFTDYRKKLYTDKLECPHCNITKNNFISTKEKIKSYNEKLKGKFEILDSFTNQNEKIRLKRISCGHIIKRNLNDIFNPRYKDVCPECNRLKRLNSLNHRLETIYNGRFKVLNGLKKYKNNKSSLLFLDTKCGNKFITSFLAILDIDNFKCPNCEIETKDKTSTVKSEVYNKFRGEYLMLSDYIDSKTPIKFKHTTCNHIFFKTKYKFFNSKIPCKECSRKSRSLGMKKAQEKINTKFGKLFTLNGIYINYNTDIPVLCNHCKKIEEVSLHNLLQRRGCKNCKTDFL